MRCVQSLEYTCRDSHDPAFQQILDDLPFSLQSITENCKSVSLVSSFVVHTAQHPQSWDVNFSTTVTLTMSHCHQCTNDRLSWVHIPSRAYCSLSVYLFLYLFIGVTALIKPLVHHFPNNRQLILSTVMLSQSQWLMLLFLWKKNLRS